MPGLYNALFGVNPLATVCMKILRVKPGDVPRMRDCYLRRMNGELQIVIYTRTGGGNRQEYENCDGPSNEKLRQIHGYISDDDDAFDSTYAHFYYRVDDVFVPMLNTLVKGLGEDVIPADSDTRWQKLLKDIKEGNNSEEAEKAMEIGKEIVEGIKSQVNKM